MLTMVDIARASDRVYAPRCDRAFAPCGRRATAGEALRLPCRALPCGDAMSPLLAVEDLSVTFARSGLLSRLINPFRCRASTSSMA